MATYYDDARMRHEELDHVDVAVPGGEVQRRGAALVA